LQLQKLQLEVGDCLHPLLKLGLQRLEGMLQVNNPVGTDLHLLMTNVKQLTGVVPPMLSLTESTVSNLWLTVLLRRWKCTATEDGIPMPQPLQLAC
jgi:hypothetical protein